MDLTKLDAAISKGINQKPDPNRECYSCVRVCPDGAIEMRGYADVMPMGAALKTVRGTHSIIWLANYRDGWVKRFEPPVRTSSSGSIEPFSDDARPGNFDLKSTALFGESTYLGADRLPIPHAA